MLIRNGAGEELLASRAAGPDQVFDLAPWADHPQASHPYLRSLVQDAAMALGLVA